MKKLLISVFNFVFIFSANVFDVAVAENSSSPFPDVSQEHASFEAIAWLKETGVVQGYPDGTFRPDNQINRAEFLKMLYESIGMENYTPTLSFPDVPEDAWYTKYVKEAFYTKVAIGYPDGTFRPDNNINFVEAVKVVMNGFFDVDELYGDGSDFTPCKTDYSKHDKIDVNAWYWKYIFVSEELCIIDFDSLANTSSGLDPAVNISRADMSELLYRAHLVQIDMEAKVAANNGGSGGTAVVEDTAPVDDTVENGGGTAAVVDTPVVEKMALTVQTINDNELIDKKYTCDSGNSQFPNGSPPGYTFLNVPEETESLAIIMSDPDASGGTFYHAVLWNIPGPVRSIPVGPLNPDIRIGTNDSGSSDPFGPCPPEGDGIHHYIFTLYAVDIVLPPDDPFGKATAQEVLAALEGHILETAQVTGLYER